MRWEDHLATLDPMDRAALSAALLDGMVHASQAAAGAAANREVALVL